MIPLEVRFWAKVDRRGPDECWPWTAAKVFGYGVIGGTTRSPNKQVLSAHRVSWELHNGPIPGGAHVLHHCDNPPCVNPAHLFLGDDQANVADKVAKGRTPCGERHHRASFTEADVVAIRSRYAAGVLQRDLAAEYGVNQQTISGIVTRRAWRHVP